MERSEIVLVPRSRIGTPVPQVGSIARNDLALGAMHDREGAELAWPPPPQRQRRPPALESGTAPPPRYRGAAPNRAQPLERIAQASVGVGDQEWKPECAAPRPPLRDDVAATGGAAKLQRQRRIGMFENDRDGARASRRSAAPRGLRLPRKAASGSRTAILMPRKARRRITASR